MFKLKFNFTVLTSALMLPMFFACLSTQASPQATNTNDPHRIITLQFPVRSVGRIFYVTSKPGQRIVKAIDAAPINARGKVQVAADQALYIILNYDGCADSSFFEADAMKEANIVQIDMHDVESGSDDSLKHFSHLIKLRRVLFNQTDVTDAGLKYLAPLQNLYGVVGSGSLIKGPGLAYLHALPTLEILEMARTNLRDCKFETLPLLSHLQVASFANCVVNDSICGYLGKLTTLNFIDISKNKITDAGVARLTGLKVLMGLNLADTLITPRVLSSLVRFPMLHEVTLTENQLSPTALTALQKALPKCRFEIKHVGDKLDANLFAPLK